LTTAVQSERKGLIDDSKSLIHRADNLFQEYKEKKEALSYLDDNQTVKALLGLNLNESALYEFSVMARAAKIPMNIALSKIVNAGIDVLMKEASGRSTERVETDRGEELPGNDEPDYQKTFRCLEDATHLPITIRSDIRETLENQEGV
jgi:hypothetical protein